MNNYFQLATVIRIGLMIMGISAIVAMYTTIKHPVNLLKNRWALGLILFALLYFFSFGVFKNLHGSPSYQLGLICGAAVRILFSLVVSIFCRSLLLEIKEKLKWALQGYAIFSYLILISKLNH